VAKDGDAVRMLGAWIGNKTEDLTPWEPVIDKINTKLERWKRSHPSLNSRKIITQMVVGGHTQFLTQAQGMPKETEDALNRTIKNFIWEDDSSPRIANETLRNPLTEGGLDLLDLEVRNEAIDIMWLKTYLNFSPKRLEWAIVTDLIIKATAPNGLNKRAIINPFLQRWAAPTRGTNALKTNDNIQRMIKTAKKFKTNLAVIRITPQLSAQLPAWYHLSAELRAINTAAAKCLLEKHCTYTVAELLAASARIRTPSPDDPHRQSTYCQCRPCRIDRENNCINPDECALEAKKTNQTDTTETKPYAPRVSPWKPLPDKNEERAEHESESGKWRDPLQSHNND
jgi:hypothetical protein